MNSRRLFIRATRPFLKLYWFVFRPRTSGVKCLIECNGRVLMIRNTYGHRKWTFPGGGLERGEEPEAAARREAREEVGTYPPAVAYLGHYFNTREYKRDTVHCFYGRVASEVFAVDPIEIAEAAWFSLDALPQSLAKGAAEALALYHKKISNPS